MADFMPASEAFSPPNIRPCKQNRVIDTLTFPLEKREKYTWAREFGNLSDV